MLLNYWSNENKVTHRGLQVQWTMAVAGFRYGNPYWEYHRIATKSYSYIGMNEATAKACQGAESQATERVSNTKMCFTRARAKK